LGPRPGAELRRRRTGGGHLGAGIGGGPGAAPSVGRGLARPRPGGGRRQGGRTMPRTMSAILTLLTLTACVSGRPEPARGGLREMLAGHSVVFENGAAQSFAADGTTVYELGAAQIGRWKVEDGRYCAVWPSGRQW